MTSLNIEFMKAEKKVRKKLNRLEICFIQKLLFLLNNPSLGVIHENGKWIYNTYEQWADELGYGRTTIVKVIANLREKKLIFIKKLKEEWGNCVNHYSINEQALKNLINGYESEKPVENQKTVEESSSLISDRPSVEKRSFCITNITNKEINTKSNKSEKIDQFEKLTQEENAKLRSVVEHKPSNTTCQEGIKAWNETIGEKKPQAKATLTKELAPWIVQAVKIQFEGSIEKLTDYFKTIASSCYIMGEKFSLNLKSALKFDFIKRILNGDLGVKPLLSSKPMVEKVDIDSVNEPEPCQSLRKELLEAYGSDVYRNWFSELKFKLGENHKITFQAKSKFIYDWVRDKYSQHFQDLNGSWEEEVHDNTVKFKPLQWVRKKMNRDLPVLPNQSIDLAKETSDVLFSMPKNWEEVLEIVKSSKELKMYSNLLLDTELVKFDPYLIELKLKEKGSYKILRDLEEFLLEKTAEKWEVTTELDSTQDYSVLAYEILRDQVLFEQRILPTLEQDDEIKKVFLEDFKGDSILWEKRVKRMRQDFLRYNEKMNLSQILENLCFDN